MIKKNNNNNNNLKIIITKKYMKLLSYEQYSFDLIIYTYVCVVIGRFMTKNKF